ncbi:hypothetical protein Daura_19590 [Dactylosporangium aurantiacum]|uniref:Uncharacterized protein n=1 Tax=Dactylosporangium aurantiacum TaxID=35754 RepID=A0A9Q9IQK4_9ACTN|nr:hypothetical protein [Dactylosporangium aurantiacum]MDG6106333.1 hypothetical protein [Dactylosporangium aurantiacum]UWZ58175.1 hypothetical protein Daura_19590 [Dactylosporangium aurantiacum]
MDKVDNDTTWRAALRQCAGTRARRWLIAVTLLLGAAAAAALGAGAAPQDRTFAALSEPVQSLMSALLPLLGILLVRDVRRAPAAAPFGPTLLAAVLVAAAVGLFGAAACALAAAGPHPWRHAALVVVGGVLVQVTAQLVGAGLGLLLRPVPVAFLATFLPLLLWLALGAAGGLREWLTPYATARHLLSGDLDARAWLRVLTVVVLWPVGLNVAGVLSRCAADRRSAGS